MKKNLLYAVLFFAVLFFSCKKDKPIDRGNNGNNPPTDSIPPIGNRPPTDSIPPIGNIPPTDTIVPTGHLFSDNVWINICYEKNVPGACWVNGDSPSFGFYIKDSANTLPDSASAILGVWLKMDSSNVWMKVPYNCWQFPDPFPSSDFTYCITPDGLSVWSWYLTWDNLEGRKADLRVEY